MTRVGPSTPPERTGDNKSIWEYIRNVQNQNHQLGFYHGLNPDHCDIYVAAELTGSAGLNVHDSLRRGDLDAGEGDHHRPKQGQHYSYLRPNGPLNQSMF